MCFPRWIGVSLLVLIVSGLLGACDRSGDSEVTRMEDGVIRLGSVEVVDTVSRAVAPSDRPLVLEGMRGSVHLRGADQSTADLSFVRRGRGDSRDAGQSVLEGISITERGTESAYTYTLTADDEAYAAVDVRGQVPRQATLRIDRLSGTVRIEGMEGPLTIEHAHGAVDVQGAAAPVEVTIKNGDVKVGFRTVPADGPIRLETANGDVHLRLPVDASAQIEARTDVGTIRTRGLSFAAEQFAPVNAGAQYNAQLGEEGPSIEVRTENGAITIGGADTTRTDTLETAPASTPTVPDTDTTLPARPTPDPQRSDPTTADTTVADTTDA